MATLVLLGAVAAVVAVQGGLWGHAAFFDLTDVDDPLSLLWNTKDSIVGQKNKECTVRDADGAVRSGVCKHASHCFLSGGRSQKHGTCGILSTCCTYERTCGRTTRYKVSYFSNEGDTTQLSDNLCEYTVHVENHNVCQVRLDFERFRLSAPTEMPVAGDPTASSGDWRCINDHLSVTPGPYGVPSFCGNNDGQHVYIHLDSTFREVKLRVRLARRTSAATGNVAGLIDNPSWRIKITQLECPRFADYFVLEKYSNIVNDYELLAPTGAIQYFINSSGRVRSFGLSRTGTGFKQDTYPSNLDYAIAFKKFPDICGIRFTVIQMNLAQIGGAAPQCVDYLYIPINTVTDDPRVCNLDTTGGTTPLPIIDYISPGPLYMWFHSGVDISHIVSSGFDLQYDTISC